MVDFRFGLSEAMGLFVSRLWVFVLLALFYLVALEWRTFAAYFSARKRHTSLAPNAWKMVRFRMRYFWGGFVLILLSFVIAKGMLGIFGEAVVPNFPFTQEFANVTGFLDLLSYFTGYISLFTIGGLVATGFVLMFSMGGRWMVNFAKLLATLTFGFFFFMVAYVITLNSGLLG